MVDRFEIIKVFLNMAYTVMQIYLMYYMMKFKPCWLVSNSFGMHV